MTSYGLASIFATASAVLMGLALAVWMYLMASDEYWLWFVILGLTFSIPPLAAIALCRMRTNAAPYSLLPLSALYASWVFLMTWLGGLFFWPAAMLLVVASAVRLFASLPRPPERVLTASDVQASRH